ncbi:ABC transporter permease [Pontivivens insulae]|uniref:Inner membrane ABC transporter permease protein YejE n=1 Tax=Pontivivens insulae TaxID=1639689 RepID=A0A2R8AE43_9RHOB|nr:ABC transporter permease [Pontivivens insulae]RED14235.1 microcin C transport system permease protein [Pontivivens insulae]SPF30310.1 Inner membrane ABC transporter permease protein YejE [Pontivivens insulae]
MSLSPLQQRRIAAFKANTRAYWSFWIFAVLFVITLFAEVVANDKPLLVSYQGELRSPFLFSYTETDFGGEFETEADYPAPEVQCLIITGGLEDCFWEDPNEIIADAQDGVVAGAEIEKGWILWPLIPYSYNTINYEVERAPSAPDGDHWLGTDDQSRDLLARVIYGFRTAVLFAFTVTIISSVVGIAAGAAQGYFGGWLDLLFQRFIEIWSSTPQLYVIIIVAALFTMNIWLLIGLICLFGWTALTGVVRAEFLRARNFEYVRAARAMGVSDATIIWRHVLPNAMVATVTLMPFLITGAISTLATLDFLGFGLPVSAPSLGEMTLQAKENLQAPWIGFTAFFTYAIMLSLLVFIFEGVRDAFDPRKVMK